MTITFNRLNTYIWFRERVYKLNSEYDSFDIGIAFIKAQEWGDKIPLGIFCKVTKPSLKDLDPVLTDKNPIKEALGFKAQGINIQEVFEEFT